MQENISGSLVFVKGCAGRSGSGLRTHLAAPPPCLHELQP